MYVWLGSTRGTYRQRSGALPFGRQRIDRAERRVALGDDLRFAALLVGIVKVVPRGAYNHLLLLDDAAREQVAWWHRRVGLNYNDYWVFGVEFLHTLRNALPLQQWAARKTGQTRAAQL